MNSKWRHIGQQKIGARSLWRPNAKIKIAQQVRWNQIGCHSKDKDNLAMKDRMKQHIYKGKKFQTRWENLSLLFKI